VEDGAKGFLSDKLRGKGNPVSVDSRQTVPRTVAMLIVNQPPEQAGPGVESRNAM